jgi:hypothetical protein
LQKSLRFDLVAVIWRLLVWFWWLTLVSIAYLSLTIWPWVWSFKHPANCVLVNKKIHMKILTSPSSGSIAGTTFSHNRAGQYTRNRRMPCQPVGSGRRGTVRTNFAAASAAWAGIGATLQLSWNNYAAGKPYTDALGQSIKLTGHQMFVAINSQLLNCGSAVSTAVPLSDTVFAAGFSAFTGVAGASLSITPSGLGVATDHLLIALSAPQSAGRGFCKTFNQWGKVAGNVVAVTSLFTAYVAQFGSWTAGQRIFYKLTPVNQYGVAGTPATGFILST